MLIDYFNYTKNISEGWWGRRDFIQRWWRLYATDHRWTPPHYGALRQALDLNRNPYLAQRSPILLYLEALPRRVTTGGNIGGTGFGGALMEEPVAATIVLVDKRGQDSTAYLALLHCVNHSEALERLLGLVMENLWKVGCQRLIGPTGLSPHLQSGALQNFFHVVPPLHTPYNPPYAPEVFESVMHPFAQSRLYSMETPVELPAATQPAAQLVPFIPDRLSGDLLPLFAAACEANGDYFPPPDTAEAAFLLRWLGVWPLLGWLAQIDDEPVGFILLQPDLSNRVRRAKGGHNLLWRLWLDWQSKRAVDAGRLLFGGVLPAWRGQGIGHQLWRQALLTAQTQGWHTLTVGPVAEATLGMAFLEKCGAQPQQRYLLYENEE